MPGKVESHRLGCGGKRIAQDPRRIKDTQRNPRFGAAASPGGRAAFTHLGSVTVGAARSRLLCAVVARDPLGSLGPWHGRDLLGVAFQLLPPPLL